MLHLTGYDLPLDEIKDFRQWESKTPGHPEYGLTAGVEATTGPLGQGLGNAVGFALAEKILANTFNRPGHEIVDHQDLCDLLRRRHDGGRRIRSGIACRGLSN